jgi:hypothetical protein
MRKFKAPVHVWEDLPAMHPTTQVAFSPDERLILTGVSAGRDGTGGALLFYDAASRELVRRIGMPSSVVAVLWHAKLNQIFVGVGGSPAIRLMPPLLMTVNAAQLASFAFVKPISACLPDLAAR